MPFPFFSYLLLSNSKLDLLLLYDNLSHPVYFKQTFDLALSPIINLFMCVCNFKKRAVGFLCCCCWFGLVRWVFFSPTEPYFALFSWKQLVFSVWSITHWYFICFLNSFPWIIGLDSTSPFLVFLSWLMDMWKSCCNPFNPFVLQKSLLDVS